MQLRLTNVPQWCNVEGKRQSNDVYKNLQESLKRIVLDSECARKQAHLADHVSLSLADSIPCIVVYLQGQLALVKPTQWG